MKRLPENWRRLTHFLPLIPSHLGKRSPSTLSTTSDIQYDKAILFIGHITFSIKLAFVSVSVSSHSLSYIRHTNQQKMLRVFYIFIEVNCNIACSVPIFYRDVHIKLQHKYCQAFYTLLYKTLSMFSLSWYSFISQNEKKKHLRFLGCTYATVRYSSRFFLDKNSSLFWQRSTERPSSDGCRCHFFTLFALLPLDSVLHFVISYYLIY